MYTKLGGMGLSPPMRSGCPMLRTATAFASSSSTEGNSPPFSGKCLERTYATQVEHTALHLAKTLITFLNLN